MAWEKPNVGITCPVSRPEVNDEFDAPALRPVWQWNHNPVAGKWSLTARPGFLRLTALPAERHCLARNTLTQKIWDTCGRVDVKLDIDGLAEGQQAGFAFLNADEFGWVGVQRSGGVNRIVFGPAGAATPPQPLAGGTVWLRGEYADETTGLYYSLDGETFTRAPVRFRLRFAGWKAPRLGLYSFGSNGGHADFDYFHFKYGSTLTHCR